MKPSILTSLFGTVLILWSCNSSPDNTSPNPNSEPQPGTLQLVQGLNSTSTSATTDSSYSYVFDLDTIKGSTQAEFILQNTGDYDVSNITLTTNNSQFYFSPSNIPVLHSSKTSMVVEVVKLNVIHGTRLDGVGYDSVLAMGNNTAMAQITASTTNIHHDSVNISQTAQIKVFAKLFDMEFYAGSSAAGASDTSSINIFNLPRVFSSQGGVTAPSIPSSYGSYIRIVNTGNVPFTIGSVNVMVDSSTVIPNNSAAGVEFNAGGVISNEYKLPLISDGNFYLYPGYGK